MTPTNAIPRTAQAIRAGWTQARQQFQRNAFMLSLSAVALALAALPVFLWTLTTPGRPP